MPEFRPFRGVRYNLEAIPRLDDVVAPPYDVLSEEDVRSLYRKSPYNVIRIDLGIGDRPGPDGAPGETWHARAGRLYRRWRAEGVLRQEARPAFYVLRQTYRTPKGETKQLSGVIGACRLTPFSAGEVLPHERTFAKPKEDRLRLMRETEANLSQVYSFYSDPERRVDRLIEGVQERAPDFSALDGEGQRHEVWVVTDPDVLEPIADRLLGRPYFIADGHHRYETALAYRRERGEGGPPQAGWKYVMMFAVNMDGGGLTILPTHRLVKAAALPDFARFAEAVGAWYEVEERVMSPHEGLSRAEETVSEATGVIGCYAGGGRWWWLVPKDRDAIAAAVPGERSRAVKGLTVTALHELVLPAGLGIDRAAQGSGEAIEYLRDPERGLRQVDRGEAAALFYLPAPRPWDVQAVAQAGDVMPHKSTFFYPKLLTGLVIFDLGEEVGRGPKAEKGPQAPQAPEAAGP